MSIIVSCQRCSYSIGGVATLATRVEMAEAVQEAMRRFRFDRFDNNIEEWDYYIQRFENELAVHGLRTGEDSADARKNLLLSKIGPEAFKVVVDYFCPDPVGTQSYQQLKETLEKHYLKGVCFFAERVKFASRVRGNDEKIAQFLNSLKAIAGHCRFGDSLSERLRDQLHDNRNK